MGFSLSGLGKGLGAMATGGGSLLFGSNPVTDALGIGGKQNEYFQPQNQNTALTQLEGMSPLDTSSGYRANDVMNNPLLGQLFGKGGQMEQTGADINKLQNQGFQLTPEDHEAYGQVSGNIARLFGQSEQNLSQSMADRGLAAAPSGAASAEFSGLNGNKNEQLSQMQMQIANNRMQNTMQRLNSARSYMAQLGGQAEGAMNDSLSRDLAGRQERLGVAGARNTANAGANAANLASMEDKREAKDPTLLQGLGQGLFNSATKIGQMPGQMASNSVSGRSLF